MWIFIFLLEVIDKESSYMTMCSGRFLYTFGCTDFNFISIIKLANIIPTAEKYHYFNDPLPWTYQFKLVHIGLLKNSLHVKF